MQEISDLEFLMMKNYGSEFLRYLSHEQEIFSIAVDYTLIGRGGFAHEFTHNRSQIIKDFWKGIVSYVQQENYKIEAYANEQISSLHSGEKMIFPYSIEEYQETMHELAKAKETIASIPNWWDEVKHEDVGYFNFDYGDKCNSLSISKVRISDIKALYLLIEQFKIPEVITSKDDFFNTFVHQSIEYILNNMTSPYSLINVPSVKDVESKKSQMEKIYDLYTNIPIGSLIQIEHPYIPFVFGRKVSDKIIPTYSSYSSFDEQTFAIECPTIYLGYDGRVKEKTTMQIELREEFPLHSNLQMIPQQNEKKVVDKAIKSLNVNTLYVKKDELVASSGWTNWEEGIQRIYEGLQIKR